MSEYSDWLDENLGAYVRYELQLAPDVALNYAAAGLVGTVAEADPVLADLPFADVGDDDLHEAVTGEKITPPGTDAAVADEVNDLAKYMTAEEKAAFADLSAQQVAEALAKAQAAAETDGAAFSIDSGAGYGTGNAEPELPDLPFADVADEDLHEAVTGESIAPAGADPAVMAEIDDLAPLLTKDEKAVLTNLTISELNEALALARADITQN